MSRFEQAKYLSEMACRLDEMRKPEYTPDELASVALCVDIMHGLAINMAGDRVSEIYSGDTDREAPSLCHIGEAARLL
jgi:hypothetical protein